MGIEIRFFTIYIFYVDFHQPMPLQKKQRLPLRPLQRIINLWIHFTPLHPQFLQPQRLVVPQIVPDPHHDYYKNNNNNNLLHWQKKPFWPRWPAHLLVMMTWVPKPAVPRALLLPTTKTVQLIRLIGQLRTSLNSTRMPIHLDFSTSKSRWLPVSSVALPVSSDELPVSR